MGVLTHVALFTWKPGTTEGQVAALAAGLATLPRLIPEIKAYRFGPDAGLADGNVDYGVVAEFDSPEGTGPTPPTPPTATSSTGSSLPSANGARASSSRASRHAFGGFAAPGRH